jgi:hypothetical protein
VALYPTPQRVRSLTAPSFQKGSCRRTETRGRIVSGDRRRSPSTRIEAGAFGPPEGREVRAPLALVEP